MDYFVLYVFSFKVRYVVSYFYVFIVMSIFGRNVNIMLVFEFVNYFQEI